MQWGLANRLAQIIKPYTNRRVMLAIDHGYFQGPTSGLEKPGETVRVSALLRDHAPEGITLASNTAGTIPKYSRLKPEDMLG